MPEAVIFDLDGVLLDSESLWNEAKEEFVRETGGTWRADAPTAMMGMSSPEWSAYLRDMLGVDRELAEINRAVVARMRELYATELPLLPDAPEVVRAIAARWPVGLASSSNREIIELFLDGSGLRGAFASTVSSEEVPRGKPAPDVYVRAAEGLGVDVVRCVAVEDSSNGIRSAAGAGAAVIAIPNPHYPPEADALALAAAIVPNTSDVTPGLVERLR